MSKFDYSRYKIIIDADSKKIQGLKVGDIVRRQYRDGNQVIYSLMVVLETGVDIIAEKESSYFIGGLIEGDEPVPGQILDFVRLTNLYNIERSGALYLTSSDSDAPFMDIMDGVATERTLCLPYMDGGDLNNGDIHKYTVVGLPYLTTKYIDSEDEVKRLYRITRNSTLKSDNLPLGFSQTIKEGLAHPERIIISYKIRGSKECLGVPVKLYVNEINQIDGEEMIDISTEWQYKVFVVTIDYPAQYKRELLIDLQNQLTNLNEWCEIAELNIVKLSDIANFTDSTKARVGKITGVTDPCFGVLEGYGAYFQHLYATRNVNIAGTLTAGDENGFSSSFYVGKIHKNVIRNSLDGQFVDANTKVVQETPPAGMGSVWAMGSSAIHYIQSQEWRKKHIGEKYCFSIWVKVGKPTLLTIFQDQYPIKDISVIPEDKWKRIHVSFPISDSENTDLSIRIDTDNVGTLLSSPQMESGTSPSQYQPTDGTLSYVEDYGAWFAKGGIGGTIQNPLLRLEKDGSIRSRNDAFVINPDGTGHFGSGRFRWTEDTITLQDVVIRWEDLNEEAKNNLKGEPGKDGEKGEKGDKGETGAPGKNGLDSNMLDWVKDWDTNKTLISSSSVITPKIFAGVKNSDETITGIAIGKFTMQTRNASGNITSENINGIYGFHKGYKTFAIDSTGNVELGRGNQVIKYDATNGKIAFGSDVSLNWMNPISESITTAAEDATAKANKAKSDAISSAASDSTTKANNALSSAKSYADTKKTEAVNEAKSNTTGEINALKTTLEKSILEAKKAGENAQSTADAITKKATDENWDKKLTFIDSTGIFTGTLSAKTVEALKINASQITAGTIDAARINVESIKASILTAENIQGLSLNVTKGKIGGWAIDTDSIYKGTKNNTTNAFTSASGSVTIGSNGIRGYRWFFDATGNAQLGSGTQFIKYNASAGKIEFGSDVIINWVSDIQIGVRNYIRKSIFDTTIADTLTLDGVTAVIDTTNKYDGYNTIKITQTAATTTGANNNRAYFTAVKQLSLASFSMWVKSSAATNLRIRIGGNNAVDVPISTVWKLVKLENIAPTSAVVLFGATTTGVTYNIAHPMLVEGVKAVDWAPSPTDLDKRLTFLSSAGIYTGTLTADQVNAVSLDATSIKTGTLSADRIAAGSIKAVKLDAASIKSDIINTTYINGLSLSFVRGTIGGWTIGADHIINGASFLNTDTAVPIQIRTTSSGSGTVYGGGYRPRGITLTWHRNNNAGHLVFGQVMSNISTAKTNYYGIQMMNHSAQEFFCLSAETTATTAAYYNRIAGWAFDADSIYRGTKNNTAGAFTSASGGVTIGSNGIRGFKWRLDSNGNAQLGDGNEFIRYNASTAKIEFGSNVTLNWTNAIEASKTTNYGYRYYKKIVINGESNKYYPVIIKGGDQTVLRDIVVRRQYGEQAPNDWDNKSTTHKGGLTLHIKANFGGWGGSEYFWHIYDLAEIYSTMFGGAAYCGNNTMFAIFLRGGGSTGALYHLYSDQPLDSKYMSPADQVSQEAPQICYNSDLIFYNNQSGTIYKANAPAPRTLTAAVEEEIRKRRFINLSQNSDQYLSAHPLTRIDGNGIYTGTLTAAQVNAVSIDAGSIKTGTLSADRIATNSIGSAKLKADEIKSNIINTAYINGLSCTFVRGSIGGWAIGTDHITHGTVGASGATPIQIRTTSTGSGYWYAGAYKPKGISLTWHQTSNAGHIVFGQVAASGNTVKTGFFGLQMMSWDHLEYFCLSANANKTGSKEVYNRIAGWAFDNDTIYRGTKNNTSGAFTAGSGSISIGSNGIRGFKWRLDSTGAGSLAGGNINWDTSGNVTFGSSVSLNWAASAAQGRMMYRDPEFYNGNNSIGVYNNSGNGTVTVTRASDSTAPNQSKYVLVVKNTGTSSPNCGGFSWAHTTTNGKIYVTRLIAKIPVGRSIQFNTNSLGTGGKSEWLTPIAGTGKWCEYIVKITIGPSSSSTNFFSLTGAYGTTAAPVEWRLAYATVFDTTSSEKYTTTIDANGIYTSTIKANQIQIDSALVVGGSTYNGSISVRNASNSTMVTLDRTGITAVAGKIGGWTINSSQIYSGNVILNSSGNITNSSKWALNSNGSGLLASNNISWDTAGTIKMKNASMENVTIAGTIRNSFVKYDSSIWITIGSGTTGTAQQNFEKHDNIIVIQNGGSWSTPSPTLPWTLNQSGRRICIVNYKWRTGITSGYVNIYAPSGKYFYEDGVQKSTLSFSREVIELMGYGDDQTFFGWIVLNRRDIMCDSRYGMFTQYLAMGTVTCNSTSSVTIKYKTYTGGTMSVTRNGKGLYTVYMPWSLGTDKYMVMMTGIYSTVDKTPIYPTLRNKYASYFQVQTSDDPSANDGSFSFMVISTADFK